MAQEQPPHASAQQSLFNPVTPWTVAKVQHAYGLPEVKAKSNGSLSVDEGGVTFTGKSARYSVPWGSMIALSNGNERVELWGTTGRIVCMLIPNGGGLAAATVMHHKLNEITIEFHDDRGGYHGAVFFLAANDASRLLSTSLNAAPALRQRLIQPQAPDAPLLSCQGGRLA